MKIQVLGSIVLVTFTSPILFAAPPPKSTDMPTMLEGWRSAIARLPATGDKNTADLLTTAAFLAGTAVEWHRLIYTDGLTIRTNLFGTTFYSLVGLHAFHVVVGLVLMSVMLAAAVRGRVGVAHAGRAETLSLYWHFVDAVWVVVFSLVYLPGLAA